MNLQIYVGDCCPRELRVATQQPMWGEALRDLVQSKYCKRELAESEFCVSRPLDSFGGAYLQVVGKIQLDAEDCRELYSNQFNPAQDFADVIFQIFKESLKPGEEIELNVDLIVITHGETSTIEDHFISTLTVTFNNTDITPS